MSINLAWVALGALMVPMIFTAAAAVSCGIHAGRVLGAHLFGPIRITENKTIRLIQEEPDHD